MSRLTEAFKKMAVALGHGSATTDYKGTTPAYCLKELAVILGCAPDVANIRTNNIAEIMMYIADNYGSEEKEPFNLARTETHATVTVKRNGKTITDGADKLWNGDKLTITATASEGCEMDTLTVNGEEFTSGDKFTVNGHNVAIIATATQEEG